MDKLFLGVEFLRKLRKLLGLIVSNCLLELCPSDDFWMRTQGFQSIPEPLLVCLGVVRASGRLGPSGEPATQIGTVPVCFRHLYHSLGIPLKGRLIRGAIEKPVQGGIDPGVPRGILGQKLEGFATGTIGILYLVP